MLIVQAGSALCAKQWGEWQKVAPKTATVKAKVKVKVGALGDASYNPVTKKVASKVKVK